MPIEQYCVKVKLLLSLVVLRGIVAFGILCAESGASGCRDLDTIHGTKMV